MKQYKSIKKVYAEPMNRLIAEAKGLVRDETSEFEDGYIVVYKDDYTSWSPKDVFEKGYEELQEKKCGEESMMSEAEAKRLKRREEINNLYSECEELAEKCEDENFATGLLINLGNAAESGDVDAIIKLGFITKIMEDK